MEQHDHDTVRDLLEAALDKLNAQAREGDQTCRTGESTSSLQRPSLGLSMNDATLPHPGHQRFTISESDSRLSPKRCFMEPDRVCVNSGVCEMRGF